MAAAEARQHLSEAEKALKTSWIGLKFAPDYLSAGMEYDGAAAKFRAAGMHSESAAAFLKAAEFKEKQGDLFGAGRAYEGAASACESGGAGGAEAAASHLERGVRTFRLCAKADIAVRLILKLADAREKAGELDAAKTCYEDAIEVYESDEKDYQLGDIYKKLIGFLLRHGRVDDALKAIDGHIELLTRQSQPTFVHKEILGKVVLRLSIEDVAGAAQELVPSGQVDGWFSSKENNCGATLVEAFQEGNQEEATEILKDQVFTFLLVDIARVAKRLKVPVLVPVVKGAGGDDAQDEFDLR